MTIAMQSSFAQYGSLSSTGLYSNILKFEISPNVQEYTVQYPLWSDGTLKRRWIQIPDSKIDSGDANWWKFPVGTKLWKEFAHEQNGVYRRIETRLLQHTDSGWVFQTFLWNEAQSEAIESDGNGKLNYAHLGKGIYHHIPSTDMCLTCHQEQVNKVPVIGFSALQLAHQDQGLNLRRLVEKNLLTVSIPDQISIKSETNAGKKALGQLHGNCGYCHNPRGLMGHLDLNLQHDIHTQTSAQENGYKSTVNVDSHYMFPEYSVSYKRILAGDPVGSVLYRRVKASSHLDPFHSEKMPPGDYGNMSINAELIENLKVWIENLNSNK
jgi:hypothetical protein